VKTTVPYWEGRDEAAELSQLQATRLAHIVPVCEPLVLISQIQRSGGTLLSQLLDGHPEAHAHPGELCIGKPKKWDWPPLDLERPETWFEVLFEPQVDLYLREGFLKEKPLLGQLDPDVFPFVFSPRVQRAVFEQCVADRRPDTERGVLDCYFTSYFNAWLDDQNLYAGPKKVVSAFTPRLAMEPERLARYLAAYPDGTFVCIVRDPCAWYASASKHRSHYADVRESIGLWRQSAETALDACGRHPDRVLVLTYEQLVAETEATMRRVAGRIGLSWSSVLLVPTFNGRPTLANSTEPVDRRGVLPERATAYRESLDRRAIEAVERAAGDVYERAGAAAGAQASR
jgi:Sulfotransferase family